MPGLPSTHRYHIDTAHQRLLHDAAACARTFLTENGADLGEDARERIVQEVVISIHRKRQVFVGEGADPRALTEVARYRLRDWRRRVKKRALLDGPPPGFVCPPTLWVSIERELAFAPSRAAMD